MHVATTNGIDCVRVGGPEENTWLRI